jgi:predicted kinase
MSGIPGSGKTTTAKRLFPNALFCSADDFFWTKDGYSFEQSMLPLAHGECLRKFVKNVVYNDWLECRCIVVDNTNLSIVELAPYVALASAYGHETTLITVYCSPEVAAARNIHGVPSASIMRMAETLKSRVLPPFWKVDQVSVKS